MKTKRPFEYDRKTIAIGRLVGFIKANPDNGKTWKQAVRAIEQMMYFVIPNGTPQRSRYLKNVELSFKKFSKRKNEKQRH